MRVISCYNNSSFFGYKSSELKSGICKYFRRAEMDKFRWCVAEMFKFRECVEGSEVVDGTVKKYKDGKCMLTNLFNRLRILLMEDVSLLDGWCVKEGIRLLTLWDANRDNGKYLYDFCSLVGECRRSRNVSYVKNFWKTRDAIDYNAFEVDKVVPFKKKGDSIALLRMGAALHEYMETRDERMVRVFCDMFSMEGKHGRRYRRSDGVYLFWQMIEASGHVDKVVFDFAMEMFFRKSMAERESFGVWICTLFLKREDVRRDPVEYKTYSEDEFVKFDNEREYLVLDDYVLKDWHVDKNFSLSEFRTKGAYVKDEEFVFNSEYKDVYMHTRVKKRKEKQSRKVKTEEIAKRIPWHEFENVEILEDGVCGGKVCCIKVGYQGGIYVLKEMKKSFNYGADYEFIDGLKSRVGLKHMNMTRVISEKGLVKRNPSKGYRGNCDIGERGEVVYCMMTYFENIGDVGKNKKVLQDEDLKRELLKIRLFDGLFRCSDNILRNVLVCRANESYELVSIDENDVFGKRERIFNKNDWCLQRYSKSDVIDAVREIREGLDKEHVLKEMERYSFDDAKKQEFSNRYDAYEQVVLDEMF